MTDLFDPPAATRDDRTISLEVNGRVHQVEAPAAARLSDVLRERLGLTGTKIGCNAGDCGACTVLVDGRQVCACMISIGQAAGRSITTVEGLTDLPTGRRLQDAFLRHGAAQCGICTPGMLIAACDLSAVRRAAVASRFPGIRLFEHAGEMLRDAPADVVCVATPAP
ncbi:MAG: 2Fe-2S iron-sulfur cluster-binding protein, partial [Geminicoccaceae bacterium]|nr:2Fe-2S iron-sulfur cluster-binding protein [Geminicoccaceae bacterium]